MQDSNIIIQLLEEFPSKPDDLFIGKKIGTGSKGVVVHKGKYQGKDVAVKIIPDLLFDVENEDELEKEAKKVHKFLKEVQLLKQIHHANIVKYLGAFYDRDGQEPMLMMELMSKTLKAYLRKHKKTLIQSQQVNICLQIAEGVKFLHHQQPPMAHRDLTNTNVLVSESEDSEIFKIGDLGQAKLKPEVNRRYFSTETPGSLAYMPPEVHGASPHYTESIDIFSLGVLMVEVATQSPPTVTMCEIGSRREFERREADLKLMGAQHPLRPIAVQCLENNYKHRLRIDEVVDQLTELVKRCNQEQVPGEENADNGSMYEPPTHGASRRDLIDGINLYIEAARAFIAHQDSGKQLLTDAIKYLNKAIKKVAAARIAGIGMAIAGALLCFVVWGLLGGAVTAPIVAFGVTKGATEIGAAIEYTRIKKYSSAIKQANQWIKEYKELSEALLKRHEEFQDVLSSVSQKYNEWEETCLNTALKGILGHRGAQITLESFQSAHKQATPLFVQWKAALQTAPQTLAKDVLAAAAEVGASTTRGAADSAPPRGSTPLTTPLVTAPVVSVPTSTVTAPVVSASTSIVTAPVVSASTSTVTAPVVSASTSTVPAPVVSASTSTVTAPVVSAPTSIMPAPVVSASTSTVPTPVVSASTSTVTAPVVSASTSTVTALVVSVPTSTMPEASAEVGATVSRVVTVAGGVVVGLSAVFIAVDLAFLAKTSQEIYRNVPGVTKLAIALREIVEDMKKQPEELQPLANLRQ